MDLCVNQTLVTRAPVEGTWLQAEGVLETADLVLHGEVGGIPWCGCGLWSASLHLHHLEPTMTCWTAVIGSPLVSQLLFFSLLQHQLHHQ